MCFPGDDTRVRRQQDALRIVHTLDYSNMLCPAADTTDPAYSEKHKSYVFTVNPLSMWCKMHPLIAKYITAELL